MRQFDLVRPGQDVAVVLQDDMHEALRSRIVAPLVALREAKHQPKGPCPIVTLDGEPLSVFLPTTAAVPIGTLGQPVGSLADHRDKIIRGLDLLSIGI